MDTLKEMKFYKPLSKWAYKTLVQDLQRLAQSPNLNLAHEVTAALTKFVVIENRVPLHLLNRVVGFVIVVGDEKAGKSTVLGNISVLPIFNCDVKRATLCPVIYFIFPCNEGQEEGATVTSPSGARQCSIAEVAAIVREKTKEHGLTTQEIIVEIRKKGSLYQKYVDLPGIVGENERDQAFRDDVCRLVTLQVDQHISPPGSSSVCLIISKMSSNFASQNYMRVFKTRPVDCPRVHFVYTHADKEFPSTNAVQSFLRNRQHPLPFNDSGLLEGLRLPPGEFSPSVAVHLLANESTVINDTQPYEKVQKALTEGRSDKALKNVLNDLTSCPDYGHCADAHEQLQKMFGRDELMRVCNEVSVRGTQQQLHLLQSFAEEQLREVEKQALEAESQFSYSLSDGNTAQVSTLLFRAVNTLLQFVVTGERFDDAERRSNPFLPTISAIERAQTAHAKSLKDERPEPNFPEGVEEVLPALYECFFADASPTLSLGVRVQRVTVLTMACMLLQVPEHLSIAELDGGRGTDNRQQGCNLRSIFASRLSSFARQIIENSKEYLSHVVRTILEHGVDVVLELLRGTNMDMFFEDVSKKELLLVDIRKFLLEKFVDRAVLHARKSMDSSLEPLRDVVSPGAPLLLQHVHKMFPPTQQLLAEHAKERPLVKNLESNTLKEVWRSLKSKIPFMNHDEGPAAAQPGDDEAEGGGEEISLEDTEPAPDVAQLESDYQHADVKARMMYALKSVHVMAPYLMLMVQPFCIPELKSLMKTTEAECNRFNQILEVHARTHTITIALQIYQSVAKPLHDEMLRRQVDEGEFRVFKRAGCQSSRLLGLFNTQHAAPRDMTAQELLVAYSMRDPAAAKQEVLRRLEERNNSLLELLTVVQTLQSKVQPQ